MSIRTKILVIVLAFLAFLGAAFFVYSVFTTSNYKRLRLEGLEKMVQYETERVNKIIAEMERGAVHFAITGLIHHETQSDEIGEIAVLEYLRSYPSAEGGGFWFEPYAYSPDILRIGIYAHYDEVSGDFVLDETMYSDGALNIDYYDYHNENWYREVFDTVTQPGQVAWTKPYIDDSGSMSLMTTAGAGVFDKNGQKIGASNIDWKIEDVVDSLITIKPTENSFALLCAPEQNYIISNTYKDYIESSYDAGLGLDSLTWDIDADTFELNGAKYVAFRRVMDNNWSLSLCIPENEIFAEAESQNNQFSIIIAVLAAAMLCIAYLLISALVNKPLKRLISDVSQIGLGNLDVRIVVNTNDEFGLLADTFNSMTVDLNASIEQNARVLAEKEHISAELDVATKIQASMLPCIFPAFPDRAEFDIFARMLPAEEVGGDFYDFFLIDDDTLAVIIADVSDKGVPAALFMVITKTLIKNNAQSGKSPKEVLETVNNMLCENNEADMFVTVFLGYLDIPSGKFTFVNAGHNPPLLRSGGKYDWLITKPGFVLAVMEDMFYAQHEVTLQTGDELLLYTDGVTEATNKENELFGEPRLLEAVNKNQDLPLREFSITLQRDIDKFTDGAAQSDDITMLVLRYVGQVDGSHVPSGHENRPCVPPDELYIEAKLENMDAVLDFVSEKLENCPTKTQNQIGIAVDEIFSNISRYAYHPSTGSVTIRVTAGSLVSIEFEDSGIEFNPLLSAEPDMSVPAEERAVGGLGIFMVKNIMDSVEYHRTNGKNILTLKKQC